ncbi:hypothetical protein ACYF6T_18675 [Streptomyces sp. 7R007]
MARTFRIASSVWVHCTSAGTRVGGALVLDQGPKVLSIIDQNATGGH